MGAVSTAPANRVVAFAPGRANLIGEHTDYNDGLSLPFAIEQGVRAIAERSEGEGLVVHALDYGEREAFPIGGAAAPRGGWRDFVAGAVAELDAAGVRVPAAALTIESDMPAAAGLGSSAALEVAVCLALIELAGESDAIGAVDLARLCSRIESEWAGARTGLLDELASLLGRAGHAVLIDFRTLETEPVPVDLGRWKLVAVDSGESRANAASGYNERRAECERARGLLGLSSLRDARGDELAGLPDPLARRVAHVIGENARVDATVAALRAGDLEAAAALLDASHASLRDLYDASTPAVERTVEALKRAGAAGARMMGGGFGGSVLALLPPDTPAPETAIELTPADGARVLARS